MPENIDSCFMLPISQSDLLELETLLNEAGLPLIGNYDSDERAGLVEYLQATSVQGQEISALFDRNLVSPLVQLASGNPLLEKEERVGRLACASVAFCIWADISIDPTMGFYEFASQNGHEATVEEISAFRVIDNFDPEVLLEYALGRVDRLPSKLLASVRANPEVSQRPIAEKDFTRSLRLSTPHYLYALKTIDLLRSHKKPLDAAIALLQWQATDGYGAGAAASYCLAAMSHKPPKGGMLKQLKSPDPEKIIAGARNATWDMMLLQQFGKLITTTNPVWWNLWTDDIALRRVADWMCARGDETPAVNLLRFYQDCWGNDADRLFQAYQQFEQVTRDTERREQQVRENFGRVPAMIAELEQKLGRTQA